MTAKYDLSIGKGSNFDFWLQYLTEGNTGIDLSSFRAEMQIKRYRGADYPLLFLSSNGGLTYGYTAGFTTGVTGIGSIGLNKKYDSSGLTGGIKIAIDSNATDSMSIGKYFYDIKLIIGTGVTYSQKLVEGRVAIEGEVV